jgi:hypothetical protein
MGPHAHMHDQRKSATTTRLVIYLMCNASVPVQKGKNSTRVLSISRRKQARVTNSTYCRLVPGDVVELLYDQQGRYAFKLIETSPDGTPLLHHTALVPSVSQYFPPTSDGSNPVGGPPPSTPAEAGALDGGPGDAPLGAISVAAVAGLDVIAEGGAGDRGGEGARTAATGFMSRVAGGTGNDAVEQWDAEDEVDIVGLEGLEARDGFKIDVAARAVPSQGHSTPREASGDSMVELAGPILGMVLSNLPFPEIMRARRVCREWNTEVKRAGNISLADVGSYFAGVVPPHPSLVDSIAKNVSARDYSFANCLWLSTGALLHFIGVPLGAVPSSHLPAVPTMQPDATQAARDVAAWDVVNHLAVTGLDGVDFPACTVLPDATAAHFPHILPGATVAVPSHSSPSAKDITAAGNQCSSRCVAIPRHTYLRYYLGELGEGGIEPVAPISPLPSTQVATLRPVGTLPSSAALIDLVSRPSSVDSESETSPLGIDSESDGAGGSCAVSVDSTQLDGPVNAHAPSTGSRTKPSQLNLFARNSAAWWSSIEDALPFALATASGVLKGEVLPLFPQPSSVALPAGAIATAADVTVSDKDVSTLRRSLPKSEVTAETCGPGNPMTLGGWGSMSPYDVAAVLVHGEVVKARAVSQYIRLLSTSMTIASTITSCYGLLVSRAYLEMSLSCRLLIKKYKENKDPNAPFLLSHTNVMDSLSVIGAATIFPPIAELRKAVLNRISEGRANKRELEAGSGDARYGRRVTVDGPLDPVADAPIVAEALAVALDEHAAVHALSASYATAAADVFDFSHSLYSSKRSASLYSAESVPEYIQHNAVSFELPFPESWNTRISRQQSDSGASQQWSNIPNVLGAPLPRTFSSPITGLDLSGCTRLAPQNLHMILEYCPHLTSLRLGGCSQFTAELLVSVAPLLKNIVYLDLEYCALAVTDAVCAAIGKHCTSLLRLQLVGCFEITDVGLSEVGLFGNCTNLRRLNLRGCRNIGDQGILSLASKAPHLRELCLAGLTTVTAGALATLVASCKRLSRFKAELWYEGDTMAPGVSVAETGPAGAESKRSFRLIGSVRSALRYLRGALPADHPALPALNARYARETGQRPDVVLDPDMVGELSNTRRSQNHFDEKEAEDHDSLDSPRGGFSHLRQLVDGDGPFAPTTNEVYMHQGPAAIADNSNAPHTPVPMNAVAPSTPLSQLRDHEGVGPGNAALFRTPPHPPIGPPLHLQHPERARDHRAENQ